MFIVPIVLTRIIALPILDVPLLQRRRVIVGISILIVSVQKRDLGKNERMLLILYTYFRKCFGFWVARKNPSMKLTNGTDFLEILDGRIQI